jgi:hypothetical protein
MGQAARGLAVRRYDRRLLAARFVGLVESIAQEQASPAHSRLLAISGKG